MKYGVFEHGFVDSYNLHLYTNDSNKDDDETTLLQNMATNIVHNLKRNIILEYMPECHLKVAGGGIKYV
eukprot:11471490-Ditylum_brightwellii.AAC.1